MRTNVIINDDLLKEALNYVKVKTKSALIEMALKALIETKSKELKDKNYTQRLHEIQNKLANTKFRESSSSIIKKDRER